MTDNFDLKACKPIRKVDVGEVIEVVDDEQQKADPDKEIKRMRFRAARDGKEGWVTLKGSQGTIFVDVSPSHYVIDKDIVLYEDWAKGSEEVRKLKAGEAFEALDPPKEVKQDSKIVLRTRALEDGTVGWLSFSVGPHAPVKPWQAKYACKVAVALTPALASAEADGSSQAEPGQAFEAVEGPTVDASTGRRRIRCSTAASGVVGWATLRAKDGTPFLEVP